MEDQNPIIPPETNEPPVIPPVEPILTPAIRPEVSVDPISQETPKPLKPILKWALMTIIVLLFGLSGFLAYQNLTLQKQMASRPTPTALPPEVKPTPTPDPTADWKIYKNDKYGFVIEYPSDWNFSETPIPGSYLIEQDQENNNSFTIRVGPLQGRMQHPMGLKDPERTEWIIKSVLEYEMGSNAHLGNYNPEVISQEKYMSGTKYVIKLTPVEPVNGVLDYDKVEWIFIPHQNQLFEIYLEGKNLELMNQILSTFRFTE